MSHLSDFTNLRQSELIFKGSHLAMQILKNPSRVQRNISSLTLKGLWNFGNYSGPSERTETY